VKPTPVGYVEPRSVDEALQLPAEHGSEAKVLDRGQSLLPLMNLRLARRSVVVDLNRVAGPDAILEDADGPRTATADGAHGQRSIPAQAFFKGPLTTALEPGELLVEVRLQPPSARGRRALEEVARGHGDFALVGVAACFARPSGQLTDARIAMFGVTDTLVRASAVERALAVAIGSPP
jgi:CO/xanthine dehydrogenase FAD-binding subunit